MKVINVTVKNKIATARAYSNYVCGNGDYVIDFNFDQEWQAYETKTARFVYDDKYTDVVFTGNLCEVPVIHNAHDLYVGVYAGDLHTTTPAYIMPIKSILSAEGTPAAPPDDVYAQITALCNEAVAAATSVRDDADAGKFNGAPGKTPVAGTDYFTEADKQAIAAEAAQEVGFPQPTSADNGTYLGCENGAAVWMPVEASGGGDGDKWETICETTGFQEDLHMYEVNGPNGPVYKNIYLLVTGGNTNTVFVFCRRGNVLPDIYSGTSNQIAGLTVQARVLNPTAYSARIEKDDIGVYKTMEQSSGIGPGGGGNATFYPLGYDIPDNRLSGFRNVYLGGGIQNIRIYQIDNSAIPTGMRCRIMGVRA